MGGQACVFYGAAEFSRDCDIAILCEAPNLSRLQGALDELDARTIAVPPFEASYLKRGHAIHFRCHATGAENMRIDVMASMRGVDRFDDLWTRRTTLEVESGLTIELMSLPDLVAAKKTKRDKDWPMIRRLVESSYARHQNAPSKEQVEFWLRECRTPEILVDLADRFPDSLKQALITRPLLTEAIANDADALRRGLADEQEAEREADRLYWKPLKVELEAMRGGKR
jgi:hypothetical protein